MKSKNKDAIDLIDEWLDDDSGYDSVVWPQLKKSLTVKVKYVLGGKMKPVPSLDEK